MNNLTSPPFTIIIYGLSGSGKSTMARGVNSFLVDKNVKTELMDADEYRNVLSPNEPFDEETRNTFRKKLFFIANLLNHHKICAVIPMIASDSKIRKIAREKIKNIYEIYIKTSIDVCISRNPKGLYTKVNGKFKENIVGIDIPFIEPKNPNITVDSGAMSIDQTLKQILDLLSRDLKLGVS